MAPAEEPDSALEFTGERFTPECVREIFYEHWHRYAWATELVKGQRVLDAACGEGYGSHLLSRVAKHVDGVDIASEAIKHARQQYQRDHLQFHQASALDLPFEDGQYDCVVSFETLEHLAEHDQLIGEFRRVLAPDGLLIISTPDKKTYSDDTGFNNEHHVRELYQDEFKQLLAKYFNHHRLYGQKLMFHSAIWSLESSNGDGTQHLLSEEDGRVQRQASPGLHPMYYLAVASNAADTLPDAHALSLFSDRTESVYQHYSDEVGKHIRAGELLLEREREIEQLKNTKTTRWSLIKQLLKPSQ